MAIIFIPYNELFAHEYQLTYISPNGNIHVGPYTYNVFKEYTVTERQKAYQDCAKWLNWQVSEIQEEWELCMYMYQWIIKSPFPFPYEQYTLSGDIIMAITWSVENLTVLDLPTRAISLTVKRVDDTKPLVTETIPVLFGTIATNAEKLALADNIWAHHLAYTDKQAQIDAFISTFKTDLKTNLEARE